MRPNQRPHERQAREASRVCRPLPCLMSGHQSGLTTVEMLLVAALMLVVAGLTVPRFGSRLVPYEEVQTSAQNVAAHLRLARRQAISGRRDHRLLLSPATAPYTSYRIEELDGSWVEVRGPFTLPDSVSCSGDREHRFNPQGRASATTSITLKRNATSRTVGVLAATGRIWVEP